MIGANGGAVTGSPGYVVERASFEKLFRRALPFIWSDGPWRFAGDVTVLEPASVWFGH